MPLTPTYHSCAWREHCHSFRLLYQACCSQALRPPRTIDSFFKPKSAPSTATSACLVESVNANNTAPLEQPIAAKAKLATARGSVMSRAHRQEQIVALLAGRHAPARHLQACEAIDMTLSDSRNGDSKTGQHVDGAIADHPCVRSQ